MFNKTKVSEVNTASMDVFNSSSSEGGFDWPELVLENGERIRARLLVSFLFCFFRVYLCVYLFAFVLWVSSIEHISSSRILSF